MSVHQSQLLPEMNKFHVGNGDDGKLQQIRAGRGDVLKRGKYMKKRKSHKKVEVGKLGIVRLHGEALAQLRRDRYQMDGGKCVDCSKELPLEGDVLTRAHLAHVRNKRMYGDTIENTRTKCHGCHIVKGHQGGKVVPPKSGSASAGIQT